MPHTDAISLAVTLGLLPIILKIVSVVLVVVSVVLVVVSVVIFLLFPSLRYVSIRSGLFFSSTIGVLQPLSFQPFTPKTIVPPLVLANAEKERQNSAFGKPPAADFYSTSVYSFSWSFKRI